MSHVFSKFAHRFERKGVVAHYHALRLHPVFVTSEQCEFSEAAPALLNAKVLLSDPDEDDRVIEHFRQMLTGHPYPHAAYFILTNHCNFACNYCFIKNHDPELHPCHSMSEEIAIKGLDFFCRAIAQDPSQFDTEKIIFLYGGEPLMNQRVLRTLLPEIRERQRQRTLPEKTLITMVSNGSLITPKIAALLKKYDVKLSISIDGDAAATNSCRMYANGQPVYEDVRRGFDIARQAGLSVGTSCTLTEVSLERENETMRLLLEELQVSSLGLNLIIKGKDFDTNPNYSKRATDFIIRAFQVFRKQGICEDRMMRKVRPMIEGYVHPFDCSAAGGHQITISPDGAIGICHGHIHTKKYFSSHVDDRSFDVSTNQDFQEWSRRSPLNMPECQSCPALGICGGGCPFQAEEDTGSLWGLDEQFCIHSKQILEWLIWDLYAQAQKGLQDNSD